MNGITVNRLYVIGDALGIDLRLSGDPKVVVRGDTDRFAGDHADRDPQVRVPLKVVSSFVSLAGDEVGLLCRSSGDLYLYAVHDADRGDCVEVHVIDGDVFKHRPDGLFEERRVRDHKRALKLLSPGSRAVYYRHTKKGAWVRGGVRATA